MALHDPSDDLQYQAELDRLTREKAWMILEAIKAGGKNNTAAMISDLGTFLGDDQALAAIIRETAQGKNALLTLLQQLALGEGERQARSEMAAGARRRKESQDEQRIERAVDARAA